MDVTTCTMYLENDRVHKLDRMSGNGWAMYSGHSPGHLEFLRNGKSLFLLGKNGKWNCNFNWFIMFQT